MVSRLSVGRDVVSGVAAALVLVSCAVPGDQLMHAGSSGADTAVISTTAVTSVAAVTSVDSTASSPGTATSSRVPAESSSDVDVNAMSPTTTEFLPGVPTISPADLADMAHFGDTVKQVDIADSAVMDKVHVSAKDAVAAATHGIGFLADGSLESVTLAYFTDATYGIPNDADPSGTGKGRTTGGVTPLIAHRLVWLVIVSNFTMPVGGPGPDGSSAYVPPMSVPAAENRMWVAVDASSGKALLASSI